MVNSMVLVLGSICGGWKFRGCHDSPLLVAPTLRLFAKSGNLPPSYREWVSSWLGGRVGGSPPALDPPLGGGGSCTFASLAHTGFSKQ